MNNLRMSSGLLLASLALSGCLGGRGTAPRPEIQLRAETALNRAIRAEQKGDAPEAERLLNQALLLSSSIEDIPAQVSALLNLSRLSRLHLDRQKSGQYIDRALAAGVPDPRLASELYFEKALVELSGNRTDSSLAWALKAVDAEHGTARGGRLNLAARIQLVRGNVEEAAALAGEALNGNRRSGLSEEEANSLRILGIAARMTKDFERGMQLLQEALQIDKRNGSSGKIAVDMEELAETAGMAGRLKESASWLERAYEVNRTGGRPERAEQNRKALRSVDTAIGTPLREVHPVDTARETDSPDRDQAPTGSSVTTRPSSKP